MCVTSGPARLSDTVIYAGTAKRGEENVHVNGYQNKAQNLGTGPNCMLIHVPTDETLGKENFISTEGKKNILTDIRDAFRIYSKGRGVSAAGMFRSMDKGREIKIFKHDIYTVLSSKSVDLIHETLKYLPEDSRPVIKDSLLQFYAQNFKDWSFLLFCFKNRDVSESNPLLWQYIPKNYEVLFAPTLDAHTGDAPDLSKAVEVDNSVTFGFHTKLSMKRTYSSGLIPNEGLSLQYRDLQDYMPKIGTTLMHEQVDMEINGDTLYRWTETDQPYRGMLSL